MMKSGFLELINEKVVLADGALGTFFYEKGVDFGTKTDLLNITDPDLVYSVHEEYIRAGSQVIETNTFGAGRFRLSELGSNISVDQINFEGARLASKAAGREIFVAGSVGPSGVDFPLDTDEYSPGLLKDAFRQQMSALLEGGADFFILETFTYLDELLLAIEAARGLDQSVPIVAQMLFPAHGKTPLGLDAVDCALAAREKGCDVFGSNCGRGVKAMLQAVERLSEIRGRMPISAFPNAGIPEVIDCRMVYSTPPSYMAEKVEEMVKAGVRLVGGCCGTTPAHIKEFQKRLHLKRSSVRPVSPRASVGREAVAPRAAAGPGGLLASMPRDRLPLFVELDPPPHLDIGNVLQGAETLAGAGASCITLAENPLAVLRADNLSLAHIIKERFGIETVLHLTCRDRNVLGLQAQVMGAHFLGIRGILAITGDPASSSDQPGASGVFDINSYGLVRMISGFNRGVNMAGRDMKAATDFSIGVAFSFKPRNPGLQLRRLEKKASLGAHFVMTQPVFDARAIESMMELTSHLDLLILPGLFPLISARNADFLHHELPGISIPAAIRERLHRYDKVEDQRKAGIEITRELIERVASFVDGLYIISPLNKWEVPVGLVNMVREAGWKGSGKLSRLTGDKA